MQLPVEPTSARNSGGGRHLIWRLKEPAEAGTAEFERCCVLLKRLAMCLSGDPAPAHPAALLRVVGSHNSKYDPPVQVVDLWGSVAPVDITDIEDMLDMLPEDGLFARKPAEKGNGAYYDDKGPVDVEARLAAMEYEGRSGTGINATMCKSSYRCCAAKIPMMCCNLCRCHHGRGRSSRPELERAEERSRVGCTSHRPIGDAGGGLAARTRYSGLVARQISPALAPSHRRRGAPQASCATRRGSSAAHSPTTAAKSSREERAH